MESRAAVKKLVTFRLDPDLLGRLQRAARNENRTLTNFVETTLLRALEPDDLAQAHSPQDSDLSH
jgi:predicted transcriptional regulator